MPPFCEMTLRAVPNKTTPPDLQFTVTLDGFDAPNNTFQLTRETEIVTDVPLESNAKDGQLCNLLCFFIVKSLFTADHTKTLEMINSRR